MRFAKLVFRLLAIALVLGAWGCGEQAIRQERSDQPEGSPYRGREVKNIEIIQENGGRAVWSPDGERIAFDRQNPDGYFDLYIMTPSGTILSSLTSGNQAINQRHNGNPTWHPSGKYIIFQSEEENHYGVANKWPGNPGIGVFNNLWATDEWGTRFWRLTDIPIKQKSDDGLPAMGVLNPHFSPDGSRLMWTERYKEGGKWGVWRVKIADFRESDDGPRLENEKVLFQPGAGMGRYVTALDFSPDGNTVLLAGNLDGQDEFGMDQYLFDSRTGELTNLQNSPEVWEEDASWSPDGETIVYMTNLGSPLNFSDPHWYWQPHTREYWAMKNNGSAKRRLTYFNEPGYPEYLGKPVIVAASSFHPEGKKLVGLIGVDQGTKERADFELKIALIELW